MVPIGALPTSVSFATVESEEMTFDINAWLAENADYQSDDVMSEKGLDHFEILLILAYMVENHYINPESYTEWDVSRLLKDLSFEVYGTKEAYAVSVLEAQNERIPAGVQVNWNATADYFLTDVPHYELENGSVVVWEDN